MKVAAYGKLCSNYEYGYSKGESGMATDQASKVTAQHCQDACVALFRAWHMELAALLSCLPAKAATVHPACSCCKPSVLR